MTEQMNVLVVMYSSFLGGAERSMLDCAAELSLDGEFVPHVACPLEGGVFEAAVERGLEAHPVHFPVLEGLHKRVQRARAMMATARASAHLFWLIRRLNARLLHANGVKACISSAYAAKACRIPYVYHVRDYPEQAYLNRTLMKSAAATIAPSEFIGGALNGLGGDCTVIANGIDAPVEATLGGEEFRRRVGVPADALVVTMMAQLAPWKRQDLFLDAAVLMGRQRRGVHFCVVGGDVWGTQGAYLRGLRERVSHAGMQERVHFCGHVADAQTAFAASDIVVLPSDREPFGRVVVEAWHHGVPVVVSDGGALRELVEDEVTGLRFESGSAEALAAALEVLAGDAALRARLGEAGREAAGAYTVEHHAGAVASVYRSVL